MAEKNFIVRNGLTVSGGVTIDSDISIGGSLTVGGAAVTPGLDSAEIKSLLSGSTGITYNDSTGAISTNDSEIVHDNLSGFNADEHIAHSTISVVAGNGLTGGGTIDSNVTINVVGGTGITVSADAVEITASGVAAATYGDSSTIPVITVNDRGQVTAVVGASVNIPEGYNDANVDSHLSGGTGITYTSGVIATNDAEIVHDNLSGFVANEHINHSGVTITAGNGLTGGGDITTSRTITVGQGTGISVGSAAISTNDAEIVHDNLSGYVANEHVDHSGVSITAGTGLSGGGDITTTRTINIANTGVVAGSYGSASQVPVFSVNAQGQIDSATTVSVAGVSSTSYDSSTGVFTINTADGGSFNTTLHDSADLESRARYAISVTGDLSYNPGTGVISYADTRDLFDSGDFDTAFAAKTTDDLTEGSTNLYYDSATTVTVARNSVSATDAGGDGSFSYNAGTGVFTYTGPSASEVRAHFTGGTGIDITTGTISTNDGEIVHDNLSGFVSNEHIDHSNVTLTAGAGLTGGGDITSSRTFNIGAGTGITVNADDVAVDMSAFTTTNLAEGNNLYYTTARADSDAKNAVSASGDLEYDPETGVFSITVANASISDSAVRSKLSAVDAGGDGSFSYNQSTGEFTYTGPSASEVRAHFSAGTGVTLSSGEISIGQAVETTSDVVFATVETTGNLVVGGNLQVDGTTTTVNTENLSVSDNMLYMNDGESSGSPTLTIDVGWAANVNDPGSYQHVGMFRDATDDTFKVFEGYTPEPDAALEINTGHASFSLAPFAARTLSGKYLGADSDIDARLSGGTGITYSSGTISTNDGQIVHDNLSGFVANEHINHSSVSITAGSGLTGGGDITTSRTLNIGEGTGITVSADAISTNDAEIVHDNLSGFVANEHINHSSVSITAGTGLSGGGDITTSRTINIANTGVAAATYGDSSTIPQITVNAQGQITAVTGASVNIPAGYGDADVEAYLSGGTGINFASGVISTNDGQIVHDNLSGFVANEHIDHSGVSITAGSGLTGGGDITTSRTLNIGEGTGITVSADAISTNDAEIVHDNLSGFVANEHIDHSGVSITAGTGLSGGGDITTTRSLAIDSAEFLAYFEGSISHDNLSGFVANEHIDHSAVSITAGNGLTGGGDITTTRTLNVGAGTGISVAADAISTNDAEIVHDNLSGFVANEHIDHSTVSITAGNGLTGGGTIAATRTLNIGAGTGITVNANDVAISNTGVSAATYGDSSTIPVITVNAQGQITAVVGAGVNIPAGYGDADVEAYLSGGTGITFSSGVITNAGVTSVNSVTGAVTATNLLDAIKTVDGASSGLDADLLDGQEGSYYRIDVYNSAGTLLN